MLKANVGLSRKVSKDYNSTGFTVNLEGEITAPTSDPQAVMEQMRELFDLAEEALDQQLERAQSINAIAGHDRERQPAHAGPTDYRRQSPNYRGNGRFNGQGYRRNDGPSNGNGNGHRPQNGQRPDGEPATNKQINYLLNIGKRQRLSTAQLERQVAEILGRQVGVYDLSKRDAATVIDALTNGKAEEAEAPHY